VDALKSKLERAERSGTLPKIVMPVHFAGQPCDMPAIFELSQRYGFKIIEDASHAIGASYGEVKIGSCVHSDITVFSFHPVKIITTGEGGMALTNSEELDRSLRLLSSHGVTNVKDLMSTRPHNEIWNYQQIVLGFNYRMTDMQAALGLSQVARLSEFVSLRHKIAERYDTELASLPVDTPWQDPRTYSSYHLYPILFHESKVKKTQPELYAELRQQDVLVNLHYIPVYQQPYYESLGFERGHCPNAERYFKSAISLPIFSAMLPETQTQVIETIGQALV